MSNNDWLKYNASEYQVGDKVYRNLEAQVLKNKEDIEAFDISGLEDDVEALQGDVEQLQTDVAGKQDELTAGSNITITGNTISATDTTYEAGEGIEIEGNVINATGGIYVIYSFSSGLVAHRSGLTANAKLKNGVTAEDLYDAYTAGKAVALIDGAGIVAFVIDASESGGVYTVEVRGYGSYHNTLPPVIPYQFYGIVNSSSQTFTVTHFFDVELTSHKVTSISGSSTNDQYPSAKCVYEAIANMSAVLADKADIDGYYEEMIVGNAEQLISSVKINDKTPYNFRTAGGSNDIGNRKNEKIVGGTIAWNQLQATPTSTSGTVAGVTATVTGGVITVTGTATAAGNIGVMPSASQSVPANHVLLIIASGKGDVRVGRAGFSAGAQSNYVFSKHTNAFYCGVFLYIQSGKTYDLEKRINVYDLTQMFGSTIADYIYSLEQANAGTGVAWFKKLFPKDYYSYNEGELMSVKTSKAVMTGFNAYNHTSGVAEVLAGLSYQITGTYTALSLEGESVTPDANGLFTPSKTGTLTVTGGDSTSTCVHLVWDGERNGEYEPYTTHEYPLDSHLELRGIPKLDANNKLYYDGDEYESDGKVTRRYEYRNYASGDENLADAITDGDSTVVKLATPTEETATPYTDPMIVNDWGTEEFVDTRTVAIPVGHDTFYLANLRAKLEMAPDSPDGDGDYIVRQSGGVNEYVPIASSPTIEELVSRIPEAPSSDGTYVLKVTVSGATKTYSWIAE